MKEKYSENIDRLFDPLKGHSFEPDLKQFNEMELRLKKLNFTKFGWRHFNIYYLVGGALNIVIVGVILYLLMTPNEPAQSTEKTTSDTVTTAGTTTIIPSLDSHQVSEEINISNKKIQRVEIPITDTKKKNQSTDANSLLIEKNTTTVPSNFIPPDKPTEVLNTEEKIPAVVASPEIKKDSVPAIKKPPVVIVKRRDTIVVYDTTKKIRKR